VLIKNLLRYEDGRTVTKAAIEVAADWLDNRGKAEKEIAFCSARVLIRTSRAYPPSSISPLCVMR